MIDLVLKKEDDGTYTATGGPPNAIFTGVGNSQDSAIGSYMRQNRETLEFYFSIIENNQFLASTKYGQKRCKKDLKPSELKAFKKLKNETKELN
jgi:hypothetical protein